MSQIKNTAIIVAAGSGNRLKSDKPKQFLELDGREILSYSVQTFITHPAIDDVIIVTSPNFQDHVVSQYPGCHVVMGGATRPESVKNGLKACQPDTDIVLIHDAARPLLPPYIIDRCIAELKTHDGIAPAIKPIDTIVQLSGHHILQLKREDLRRVQTPQCFHLKILQQAYESADGDTDEMGLVNRTIPQARLGYIEGAPQMMKVTNPEDLALLKFYLDIV